MWKRLSPIFGLLAFVVATVAGPAMAQVRMAAVEPMPCHEMAMSEQGTSIKKPVQKTHTDCDGACQCPVSHCAAGPLTLPQLTLPMIYDNPDFHKFFFDQRLSFGLSEDLMRPPRA
ncbi:hypothetical protein [Asticcacaulis excentricus]|uniref:hypothetical protein n=1 Tax=Asticcacaulis excentricus TaxID=78587 RepID=UPI000318AF2B|nr:hypothetical protein [Asticcacaulis excentricus]